MSKLISMPDKKKKHDARLSVELNRPMHTPPPSYARDLVNSYIASHNYRGLSIASRRIYRRALSTIATDAPGDLPLVALNKLVCNLSPGMASQVIAVGSAMCSAMNVSNPFKLMKKPKCGEWEAWTPEDVALVGKRVLGSRSLLLFLGAFSGQRLSDIRLMQWPELAEHKALGDLVERIVRSGMLITVPKQSKTGEDAFVPIPSTLFLYYANLIGADVRSMLTSMMAEAFCWHERKWLFPTTNVEWNARELARMSGKPFHGLRKTCSVLLAEGECSPHEIMAVTGHKTIAMLVKYTRSAEKKRLAVSAMAKMQKRLDAQEVA
jgi:hypothetical protein